MRLNLIARAQSGEVECACEEIAAVNQEGVLHAVANGFDERSPPSHAPDAREVGRFGHVGVVAAGRIGRGAWAVELTHSQHLRVRIGRVQ